MGVTHRTVSPVGGSRNACQAPSATASVLPVPVVAWRRPLSPDAMRAQTSFWKSNGRQPFASNHCATA